jgi:hypothetical protein
MHRQRTLQLGLLLVIALLVPDTAIGQGRRRSRRKATQAKPTSTKVVRADRADRQDAPMGGTDDAADQGEDAEQDDGGDVKSTTREVGSSRGGKKEKLFDFEGLNFDGATRMPQLLYFLDRANEELQRASLERRSFVPEMVRSVDEEAL